MKKIKILYVTYDGLTDPLGQSQIIPYLSKLASNDIFIDIISFEKKNVFYKLNNEISNKISQSNVQWKPLFYTKKPPIFSTVFDIYQGYISTKVLFKKNNYDILHCRGYISAIMGLKLKKKYNPKLIFDMRGWWPDEKKESGLWSGKIYNLSYQYFKKKEIQLFQKSDKIISLTYSGKKEIIKNNWTIPSKIGVIPTCVDFENFPKFNEKTRLRVRKELSINNNSNVLVHSGSLGGNYDLKEFSLIFKSFLKFNNNNLILIVTKTPKGFILNKLKCFKLDVSRVIIVESDFSQVYQYLQASDVGLILYKRAFSTIGRSPTKLGEYWASGIPAISLKNIGDLDFIYEKYPFGIELLEDLNDNCFENISESLFSKRNINNLRNAAKEFYHIEKGISFYANIYNELIS